MQRMMTATSAIQNTRECFPTAITCLPLNPQTTNRSVPKGGVACPIAMLNTKISPNWTGSIPKAAATGAKRGPKIRIDAPTSMNIPRKRSRTTTPIMKVYRLLTLAIRKALKAAGI